MLEESQRTTKAIMERCEEALQECGTNSCGISKRTFQKDLADMERLYGVGIKRKRTSVMEEGRKVQRYCYQYEDPDFSIRTVAMSPEQKRTLEGADFIIRQFSQLPQMDWLKESALLLETTLGMQDETAGSIFAIEKADSKGIERLPLMAKAIRNRQVISMTCRTARYGEKTYVVSPVYLKQYNRRWYLFGYVHKKETSSYELYTFPLDNVEKYSEIPNSAYHNEPKDWHAYFNQFIGVTNYTDREVKTIRLRVFPGNASATASEHTKHLLKNTSLHETQTCVENSDGTMDVTLCVKINRELVNSLLKYADNIQIIEPQELRDEIVNILKAGIERNMQIGH
ncbi:MAG: WYL domain-containing protein [Paludibacteraceae bacterium]|nr:WYL domain-containing protein [Paludibacteraceae bacterium]